MKKKVVLLLLALLLVLTGCFKQNPTINQPEESSAQTSVEQENTIEEEKYEENEQPPKEITSKDEVALYIHKHGKLPDNFITKKEAQSLGWQASKGNLWEVAPGKSIGGDKFGNREGNLPDKKGRIWYECDIDYKGGRRGAKRIVFSNDGLIYYTGDHYKTFEEININEDPS